MLAYYRIELRQCFHKLHRDLRPTFQWGYDSAVPGPTFETRSGQGLLVEFVNRLPSKHLMPIDHNLHGAGHDAPDVRTVVHLHGGKVPPDSDGYPEDWFVPGESKLYYYPNDQEAAMLWYHDHAMGITRLNIFAGLLGAFIVRDDHEDSLKLPRDAYEIPLILFDRTLDQTSQLNYPVSGVPGAPWVPEFNGNAIVVNGKVFPYLEVEPRKYRLRVLNAANFRFFDLSLSNRKSFHQIGTDLGLLPSPVELTSVELFPAERADLVIDFTEHAGQTIEMNNLANGILQFRVLKKSAEDLAVLPPTLRSFTRIKETEAARTRVLKLTEVDDYAGKSMVMLLDGKHFHEKISETPVLNSTEIWELVNLTGDTHPIHLHLARLQVLDRRHFDRFAYNLTKKLVYNAPAVPPAENEIGWKDTIRSEPETVTRIAIRFEGYTGRYVWHCHLLEHEDNEMMRPYEIIAQPETGAANSKESTSWCGDSGGSRRKLEHFEM